MLRNARIYVCTAAGTPTWDQFLGAVMDAPWSPLEPLQLHGIGFHAASEKAADGTQLFCDAHGIDEDTITEEALEIAKEHGNGR